MADGGPKTWGPKIWSHPPLTARGTRDIVTTLCEPVCCRGNERVDQMAETKFSQPKGLHGSSRLGMTPRPRGHFLQLPPSGHSSPTLASGASLQHPWAPEWPPCRPEGEQRCTWSASPGVSGWWPLPGE